MRPLSANHQSPSPSSGVLAFWRLIPSPTSATPKDAALARVGDQDPATHLEAAHSSRRGTFPEFEPPKRQNARRGRAERKIWGVTLRGEIWRRKWRCAPGFSTSTLLIEPTSDASNAASEPQSSSPLLAFWRFGG